MRVADLMTTDVITLNEDDNLDLAHMEMSLARIRHLPVVRKDRLVGLVTHRDILKAMCSVLAELDALEQSDVLRGVNVQEIMMPKVETVDPDDNAAEAGRRMLEGKIGCLPVVSNGDKLVGIITEADFVELAVAHLKRTPRADEKEEGDGYNREDGNW